MSGPYRYQNNPLHGQGNPYAYQPGGPPSGPGVNPGQPNPSYTGQPFGQTGQGSPDFFPLQNVYQNVSPEMLNTGLSVGKNIIQNEWDKRMTGVSSFWLTLKIYFAVSNSYVLNKIILLLYPLSHEQWNRIPVDESIRDSEQRDQNTRKFALPKHDTNAPDLYIPLMSFISYILLYGFVKGLALGSKGFSPDLLVTAVWRCLFIQALEVLVIKFGFILIGVTLPSLDITSYTGYKYVGLCVNILSRACGRFISILVVLYTSAMLGYFVLKSLAAVVPQSVNNSGGPPRHLLIIGFAILQCFISLFLSWL